jgi:RNA polymerase-binding transcription factor DksA
VVRWLKEHYAGVLPFETRRTQVRDVMQGIEGVADLQLEKQMDVPQPRAELRSTRTAALGDRPSRDPGVYSRSVYPEAQSRMEQGTYGRTSRCAGEIAYGRLMVLPEARTCAACGSG